MQLRYHSMNIENTTCTEHILCTNYHIVYHHALVSDGKRKYQAQKLQRKLVNRDSVHVIPVMTYSGCHLARWKILMFSKYIINKLPNIQYLKKILTPHNK